MEDIPHVFAIVVRESAYGIAVDRSMIEERIITQILESLGITFAYDLCFIYTIEHPNKLPRITIRCCRIRGCRMIVFHKFADLILVSSKLINVRLILISSKNTGDI